jgi:hypothetical protein
MLIDFWGNYEGFKDGFDKKCILFGKNDQGSIVLQHKLGWIARFIRICKYASHLLKNRKRGPSKKSFEATLAVSF